MWHNHQGATYLRVLELVAAAHLGDQWLRARREQCLQRSRVVKIYPSMLHPVFVVVTLQRTLIREAPLCNTERVTVPVGVSQRREARGGATIIATQVGDEDYRVG